MRRAQARWAGPRCLVLLFWAFTLVFAPAQPAAAQNGQGEAAPTQPGEPVCVACHRFVSADVVDTWRDQAHGRNEVGCPTCHNAHDRDFRPNPQATVCAGCHDLAQAHPQYQADSPGSLCMDCHQANVHWYPGEGSWFTAGLPPERLREETTRPESDISATEARTVGAVAAGGVALVGLAVGFALNRLLRKL